MLICVGWEVDSFGIHSDDGMAFLNSNSRKFVEPFHERGVTVGLGVDALGRIFFTKNGAFVGYSERLCDEAGPLHFAFGAGDRAKSGGTSFMVSFRPPFLFNLASLESAEKSDNARMVSWGHGFSNKLVRSL
jgi:hypothetical protein